MRVTNVAYKDFLFQIDLHLNILILIHKSPDLFYFMHFTVNVLFLWMLQALTSLIFCDWHSREMRSGHTEGTGKSQADVCLHLGF